MQLILLQMLFAAIQLVVSHEDFNDTWMYMPDGDGQPQVAYLTEPNDTANSENEIIQIEYYERSKSNSSKQSINKLNTNFDDSLIRKNKNNIWEAFTENFNLAFDTKILVHGWKSSTQSNSIKSIRRAYLEKGNTNVFAINWRNQADNIYYLKPARYTLQVGRIIAKLINYLVEEKNADPNRIHLIGHSLGAHIMGYAGSYSRHRVGRITGLDPARPAFEDCIGPENHLDYTDAKFVDVIHSCAGFLGFKTPIAHVDFYPNGGAPPQPGCSEITQVFTGCSHGRSYEYFAESITSTIGFYARKCNNYEEVVNANCSGSKLLMGNDIPLNAKGIYYLKTGNRPSFALGLLD